MKIKINKGGTLLPFARSPPRRYYYPSHLHSIAHQMQTPAAVGPTAHTLQACTISPVQ